MESPPYFVKHYSLESFFNEIIETAPKGKWTILVRKEYVSYQKNVAGRAFGEEHHIPHRFVDLILSMRISDVVHKFRQVIDAKMTYETTPKGLEILMIDWDKKIQEHVSDLSKSDITVKIRTGEFIAFSERGIRGGDI